MAVAGTSRISAHLNKIYGEDISRKYELKGPRVLIGRSSSAHIRLETISVSRKHCILTYTDEGWRIKDNHSSNGTWICGQKLEPDETRLLQCGDIIFLGPPAEMPQAFCYDYSVEEVTQSSIEQSKENSTLTHGDSPIAATQATTQVQAELKDRKVSPRNEVNRRLNLDSPVSLSDIDLISPVKNLSLGNVPSVTFLTSGSRKRNLSELCSIEHPYCKIQKQTEVQTEEYKLLNIHSRDGVTEQINEISSTGNDELGDSQSLLEITGEDITDLHCESIGEEGSSSVKQREEAERLKSKLAKLSAAYKKLHKSRLDIINKNKLYVEKKKELEKEIADQQLKQKGDIEKTVQQLKSEVKKELMGNMEEHLVCNICTELLIKPMVLDCSHTFCEYCISEWKKKKNECPVCRNKIQTMTPVLTLQHFIDKAIETLSPEERAKRDELVKERTILKEQKKVAKASPRRRRFRSRSYRNSFSRRGTHVGSSRPVPYGGSSPRQNIEIPQRRNLILPIPLSSYPLLIGNENVRVPEILISDNEMDTINIYVS